MSRNPNIPEFHSELLREAVADAQPVLASFEKQFDKISDDIKLLEAYLRSCSIVSSFGCEVSISAYTKGGGGEYTAGEPQWPQSSGLREDLEGKVGQLCIENLVWTDEDITGNRGKFRLYFETLHANGVLSMDGAGKPRLKEIHARSVSRRPLIESPIEIRLRMKEQLPGFIERLARQLKSEVGRVTFEDCRNLEDPALQELLRSTPRAELVAAMAPIDADFRAAFLRNITSGAQELVAADLAAANPPPQASVNAQRQIALRLQQLIGAGRVNSS